MAYAQLRPSLLPHRRAAVDDFQNRGGVGNCPADHNWAGG